MKNLPIIVIIAIITLQLLATEKAKATCPTTPAGWEPLDNFYFSEGVGCVGYVEVCINRITQQYYLGEIHIEQGWACAVDINGNPVVDVTAIYEQTLKGAIVDPRGFNQFIPNCENGGQLIVQYIHSKCMTEPIWCNNCFTDPVSGNQVGGWVKYACGLTTTSCYQYYIACYKWNSKKNLYELTLTPGPVINSGVTCEQGIFPYGGDLYNCEVVCF